jgi:hypothetical protein
MFGSLFKRSGGSDSAATPTPKLRIQPYYVTRTEAANNPKRGGYGGRLSEISNYIMRERVSFLEGIITLGGLPKSWEVVWNSTLGEGFVEQYFMRFNEGRDFLSALKNYDSKDAMASLRLTTYTHSLARYFFETTPFLRDFRTKDHPFVLLLLLANFPHRLLVELAKTESMVDALRLYADGLSPKSVASALNSSIDLSLMKSLNSPEG